MRVGRGLAQAMGTLTKHGVKQVDRLLSNRGVDVWTFFAYWTPYLIGARTEVVVALDWTSFAADEQETIVLSMLTGHGRATPLLWKTVASSTLKDNQRRYEYEVLCRLREVLPNGVPSQQPGPVAGPDHAVVARRPEVDREADPPLAAAAGRRGLPAYGAPLRRGAAQECHSVPVR